MYRLKFFNKDPKDGERYRDARDEDALQTFINTQLKGPQEKQVELPLFGEMLKNNLIDKAVLIIKELPK